MDVTVLLKKDHDRVRALFQKYRGGGGITGLVKRVTGNVPPRQRHEAIEAVCRELDLHTRVEEEIFYPAVGELHDAELDKMVQEAVREHARVKELVSVLRTDGEDDANRDANVTSLEECVEHHATEEENDMFPRLQDLMPEATREELGRRIRAVKRSGAGTSSRVAGSAARRRTGAQPRKARGARASGGKKTTTAGRPRKGRVAKRVHAKAAKPSKRRSRGGRR